MRASQVPMEMSLSRLRVAESASKSQNRRIPVPNSLLSDTAAILHEKNATQTAVSWWRLTGAGLGVDAVVAVRVMPLRPARPLRRHRVGAQRLVHCVQPRPEPVQELRERQRCGRRFRVSRSWRRRREARRVQHLKSVSRSMWSVLTVGNRRVGARVRVIHGRLRLEVNILRAAAASLTPWLR